LRCLVTGAAGFVGSHLSERLIRDRHDVVGIDSFSDYYSRSQKDANLFGLRKASGFSFAELDLAESTGLRKVVENVDVVFHLAGQPGVRASWGDGFAGYIKANIVATQRLLEVVKDSRPTKFVYASSSSIYGDAEAFPTPESVLPRPVSPYGMTKLAGEHLCFLYGRNFNFPVVAVRYFTVYGPRQRPDMAFSRFIKGLLEGTPVAVYGDGEQTRDFTFIDDAVEGTLQAALHKHDGETFNLGGGSRVTVNQVLALLESIIERPATIVRKPSEAGDARHTCADTRKAQQYLGYQPRTDLEAGLQQQVKWTAQRGTADGKPN
jgi:UDP-glucose 4-epimerase